MRCCRIGHERLGSYEDKTKKCVICAGEHRACEHLCGLNECSKKTGKLCVHVVPQCANCQGNHQANSAQCPFRQKAEVQVRNNKAAKKARPEVKATSALGPSKKDEEILTTSDQEIDTKAKEWAKEPGKKSPFELEFEGINHIKKY